MILADTSIWVDHLRANDAGLARLLEAEEIVIHPFIIGEIALGTLHHRQGTLRTLARLPRLNPADDEEVLHLINRQALYGRGIGYVDAHLLAAARLHPGMRLWTRDRRLAAAAASLGLAA